MKVFPIILWLLLGILYWWIWGSGNTNCCNTDGNLSNQTLEAGILGSVNTDADSTALIDTASQADTTGSSGGSESEDLNGDGIPDSEQDFTQEEISQDEIQSIDPNESEADEAKVVETENSALIHFPYNSTYKLDSKAIEEYLSKVAQRVQQTEEKILLTGHGDVTGTDNSNIQIGQYRANTIRDYLVSKGVNPQQITAITKGRFEPIASNKTREGRAKNRRVELVIQENK